MSISQFVVDSIRIRLTIDECPQHLCKLMQNHSLSASFILIANNNDWYIFCGGNAYGFCNTVYQKKTRWNITETNDNNKSNESSFFQFNDRVHQMGNTVFHKMCVNISFFVVLFSLTSSTDYELTNQNYDWMNDSNGRKYSALTLIHSLTHRLSLGKSSSLRNSMWRQTDWHTHIDTLTTLMTFLRQNRWKLWL